VIEEHALKIALLEQRVEDMKRIPDRVLLLETGFDGFRGELSEIKKMQISGSKDRQHQYELLSRQISEHHQTISSRQDQTQETVNTILASWRATCFIAAGLGSVILIAVAIYQAWPS
jgi:ABC-type uncharacterized transport system ATPase subunit